MPTPINRQEMKKYIQPEIKIQDINTDALLEDGTMNAISNFDQTGEGEQLSDETIIIDESYNPADRNVWSD